MGDFHATTMDEFAQSTFDTVFITRRPISTLASEADETTSSKNESQPTVKATMTKNERSHEIAFAPSTTTRTAPYSALPFHRPYSTGDGWGKGEGQILSPLEVGSALAMQIPRLNEVDQMKIAKIYSGAYTFGLCLITVAGLALAKWIWNGCPTPEEYRRRLRQKEEQEKWSRWF